MAQREKDLQIAFNQTFKSESGKMVLDDLFTFCHMREPGGTTTDPIALAIREGRRDVIMHIIEVMNMPTEEIIYEVARG